MSDRLFPIDDVAGSGDGTGKPEPLAATQRLTAKNRTLLAQGIHPATRRPLLDGPWQPGAVQPGPTCGSWCGWVLLYENGSKSDVVPPRPSDWRRSIEHFLTLGFTPELLAHFVEVTMRKGDVVPAECWHYFCGCCWRHLEAAQAEARRIIAFDDDWESR